MPNRMEIELTSRRDDVWTWRAAGARQPKGTVTSDLVPDGAAPGDQFRAEVESSMDGVEILSLLPRKGPSETVGRGERIEHIGAPRRGSDVSVILASGGSGTGGRRSRDRRAPRGREGEGGAADGGAGGARRDAPGRERRGSERRGPERSGGERSGGSRSGDRRPGPARRDRRLPVSTAHRNAALASLRPEQLPIAEQLLRGGLPAVRQALAEQHGPGRPDGGSPGSDHGILTMAEELLPVVNLAAWKDRAAAAVSAGRDVRLRELRAIVAASRTVSLDAEGQEMARSLRESLDRRVTALQEEWVSRMTKALAQGRVVDALTEVANPPEPGTRCPAEVALQLTEAAGQAMSADLDPDAWIALLDAATESPVRRTIKPAGIPDDESARAAARNAAGLIPGLAKLLGIRIPPPPPRRRITVRTPTDAVRDASGEAAS